ncbi:MAG TPA: hypothetical protein VKG38_10285 [Solirubrobacteraceae bacterium]|nr:hypothetical protein [Solirubrobacteraceae bacterium]
MVLAVDWESASVSPTATGLLWVEVKVEPIPDGAESELLSAALGELSHESELVDGIQLRGNLIRLHINPGTDVPAVKRILAAKLDEFGDQAEQRLQEARARSAEIEARRAEAEASAPELQAQFRGAQR